MEEKAIYQILQWTPFPNTFENIPEWQLQAAEYDLKINTVRYYEWAIKVDGCFLYPLEIAECIVRYWENRWPFASYLLHSFPQSRMQVLFLQERHQVNKNE